MTYYLNLFKTKRISELVILSLIFQLLVFFLPSFIATFLPSTIEVELIIWIFLPLNILSFLNFLLILVKIIKNNYYRDPVVLFTLIYLAFITLFSLVITASNFTPPLHDPVSHALWSKSILENNGINYFYSPLLHTIVASLNTYLGISIPKLLLFTNTFFSLFIPMIIFIVSRYILKSKNNLSISIFIFLIISNTFSLLSINAGKNAMILNIIILSIYVFSLYRLYKKKTFKNLILFLILAFLSFFTHYPSALLAFLYTLPIIIISFISFTTSRKKLFTLVIVNLITLSIVFIWLFVNYKFFHIGGDVIEKEITLWNGIEFIVKPFEIFTGKLFSVNGSYIILSIMLLLISKKINSLLKLLILYILGSMFFVYPLIKGIQEILNTTQLEVIILTQEVLMPLIFSIPVIIIVLFLLKDLNDFDKLEKKLQITLHLFFIGSITLFLSFMFVKFDKKIESLKVVDNYDIEAYNFIKNNLDSEKKFLVNSHINDVRKQIVFATDGGLWIPVFTNNEITNNFLNFNSTESHYFNDLYLQLKTSEDDAPIVDLLKQNGVQYLYIDQDVYSEGIRLEDINNVNYTIEFTSGPVKIIRFD